jgi:methyl-accepting chemotaxis protein
VKSIALAIEQQSTVTRTIAGNVGEASARVNGANQEVALTSQVSGEVSRDVLSVNTISSEIARTSEQLLIDSAEISKVAGELKTGMRGFQEFYNSYFSEKA